MCSSLHTTSVRVMDATAPPVPRWTLETDCFRRPFRSHGSTLTLSVPEPLFRDVLLSSAKTLRRNSGLHATPAGVEDPTAPSHCWDAFQTDCFRRPFRSHGLTLTLVVPEPLFQLSRFPQSRLCDVALVCTLPLLVLRAQQDPRPLYFRGPDRLPRCRGNRAMYIAARGACQ